MNFKMYISFVLSIFHTVLLKEVYGILHCNIISGHLQHCCAPKCKQTPGKDKCNYTCPHDMYVYQRLCPWEHAHSLPHVRCISKCPKSSYGITINNEKVCVDCAILCQNEYLQTSCMCDFPQSDGTFWNLKFKILVIVCGALVVLLFIVCCFCCHYRRKQTKSTDPFNNLEKQLQGNKNPPKDKSSIEETDLDTIDEPSPIGTNLQELAVEAQIYQDEKTRYRKDPTSGLNKKVNRRTRIMSSLYENAAAIRLNNLLKKVSGHLFGERIDSGSQSEQRNDPSTSQGIVLKQNEERINTATNEMDTLVHNITTSLSNKHLNDKNPILKKCDNPTVNTELTESKNIERTDTQGQFKNSETLEIVHQNLNKHLEDKKSITEKGENKKASGLDSTTLKNDNACRIIDGQACEESYIHSETKDERDDGYGNVCVSKVTDGLRTNTRICNVSKPNKNMARESSSSETSNSSTQRSDTSSGVYETEQEDQDEVAMDEAFSKKNNEMNKNALHNRKPKPKNKLLTNRKYEKQNTIGTRDKISAIAQEVSAKPIAKVISTTKPNEELTPLQNNTTRVPANISPANNKGDRQVKGINMTDEYFPNPNVNRNDEEDETAVGKVDQSELYENVSFGKAFKCSEDVRENDIMNTTTGENIVQLRHKTNSISVRESIISDTSICTQRSNKSSSSYETATEGDDGTFIKAIAANSFESPVNIQTMTGQTNLSISNSTVNFIVSGQQNN